MATAGSRGATGNHRHHQKAWPENADRLCDFYYGAQQVTKKLDLLNAQDWATLDREFWRVFRNEAC